MWVITKSVNDYNQHGDYFVAVFTEKPTFAELKVLLNLDDVTAGKLTRGGGRQNIEGVWYNLEDIQVGVLYEQD